MLRASYVSPSKTRIDSMGSPLRAMAVKSAWLSMAPTTEQTAMGAIEELFSSIGSCGMMTSFASRTPLASS